VEGSKSEAVVSNDPEPQRSQMSPSEKEALNRMREFSERTAVVAHDLNNMLGTMIGYGALMLEDLSQDNPNHAFLAKVLEAGAEAKHLVAGLLESARRENLRASQADPSRAA
jgi:two-component system, cell cycle sensor histidine kinase and response regulator CckA